MAQIVLDTDRDLTGPRQRIVLELVERLGRAEAVLRSLHEAEQEADRQSREFQRADAMKTVTGTSGIERAIAATTRMVDLLKREISDARRAMSASEVRRLDDLGSLSLVG